MTCLRSVVSSGTRMLTYSLGRLRTGKGNMTVKIEFANRKSLTQVSTGIEMNILDENLKGIHPPFMCKDYAQDIFWSEIVNKPVNIYGLSWEPGKFNVSKTEWFNLGLRPASGVPTKSFHPYAKNIQKLLNLWDKTLGIPLTEVHEANDGMLLVRFHRLWTLQPIRVSMFLLMVRCGFEYKDGETLNEFIARASEKGEFKYSYMDRGYLHAAKNKILKVLEEKKFYWKQEYKDFKDGHGIHITSGIVSYNKE